MIGFIEANKREDDANEKPCVRIPGSQDHRSPLQSFPENRGLGNNLSHPRNFWSRANDIMNYTTMPASWQGDDVWLSSLQKLIPSLYSADLEFRTGAQV